MPKPGIALTFDDYTVNDWYKCLPLFDSFGVRATYYISNYNKLSREEISKLKIIQQHGHEIAFHTTNHCNLVKYLNNTSMSKLVQNEIVAGLKKMNADQFYPTTFAYPYGQHNQALDNELLKYFKSVRALNGTNNYTKSMAIAGNNKILYGLGIDVSSKRPLDVLLKLVHNAYENNVCLVFVSHHVDQPQTNLQTPLQNLRAIIREASSLGMNFYTISEISN